MPLRTEPSPPSTTPSPWAGHHFSNGGSCGRAVCPPCLPSSQSHDWVMSPWRSIPPFTPSMEACSQRKWNECLRPQRRSKRPPHLPEDLLSQQDRVGRARHEELGQKWPQGCEAGAGDRPGRVRQIGPCRATGVFQEAPGSSSPTTPALGQGQDWTPLGTPPAFPR